MLLNKVSITQISLSEFLNRVDGVTPTGEADSFHISLLGSPQSKDAVVGKHLKADGVNSLLINHNETLVVALTDLVLQVNNLLAPLVSESPLALGHFVPISGIGEEELGVDFSLLVFQRHIAGQNATVLQSLGHIGVPSSVVEHQSLDQLGITGQTVNHMHDLHHVQVNGLVSNPDDVDSVNHDVDQLVG